MPYLTTVELDENLLNQAKSCAKTEKIKEVISIALAYYVSHTSEKPKPKKNILDLEGKIKFADGYDYKAMRGRNIADNENYNIENLLNLKKATGNEN